MTQTLLPSANPADLMARFVRKPTSEHDRLVKQTQKWVSQTFYGALLKQVRNSPFHSDLFDGGHGGQAFGTLLDQQFADRMSRSAGSKLVNGIVRRIEARAAYKNQEGRHTDIKINGAPASRA